MTLLLQVAVAGSERTLRSDKMEGETIDSEPRVASDVNSKV